MSSESTPQQERFDDSVFRSVFEAEPDAVLLVDTAGRIVLANRACSNLLGYSHQELLARSEDDLVPEASAARHAGLREGFSRAPRTRPMGNELELNARRADGSEVMIEIALSPLRYGDQMLVLASIRGIGDYPRVQRAMRRSRFNETIAQVARLAVDARDPQELIGPIPPRMREATLEKIAVNAVLAGKKPEVTESQAAGCGISYGKED